MTDDDWLEEEGRRQAAERREQRASLSKHEVILLENRRKAVLAAYTYFACKALRKSSQGPKRGRPVVWSADDLAAIVEYFPRVPTLQRYWNYLDGRRDSTVARLEFLLWLNRAKGGRRFGERAKALQEAIRRAGLKLTK